jgi:hypothetical protein
MDKLLRGVDVPSFKPVTDKKSEPGTDWGYDNFRVYYKDKEVSQLTPKNLKVFSSFVVKDDHSVLCNEYPLKDVDAPTFKRLNGYYAKDKRHGYILFSGWVSPKVPCLFFIIDEADPATLRGFVKDTWMYDNLAIDSKHIFLNGDIIPNIDLKNFNPDALYERMEAENMSTSKTGIGKD